MAKTLRGYLQTLSDKELIQTFCECQEWRDTTILPSDGMMRMLHQRTKEIYGTRLSLDTIEKEIYYEMAIRYYASMAE